MPPTLTMDVVAAVEDAFLRGEWTQALNDSRSLLAARIVQQQPNDSPTMTTEEERVLSVYLQAVFELDLEVEVETAATITKAFTPLPSGIAIQWGNFLLAMNRRSMAKEALVELLKSYDVDGDTSFSTEQYAKAVEVLVLQLLLPEEGIETARQFVTEDNVLDDGVKLQLLRRIQATHLAAQGAMKEPSVENSASPNGPSGVVVGERQSNDALYQSESNKQTGVPQGQDDDSSCYVMIGGTAIALAVAAAGALRYREKIHECVSNALPAISKGLADAKYVLFEA